MVNKKVCKKLHILDTLDKFQRLCIGISRYDLKHMEELKKMLDDLEEMREGRTNGEESTSLASTAQTLYHYIELYEKENDIVKAYVGLTGISYTKLFKRSLLDNEKVIPEIGTNYNTFRLL